MRQANGEASVTYVKLEIDLHVPERVMLVKLLCEQLNDLSEENLKVHRIMVDDLMIKLSHIRETLRLKTEKTATNKTQTSVVDKTVIDDFLQIISNNLAARA